MAAQGNWIESKRFNQNFSAQAHFVSVSFSIIQPLVSTKYNEQNQSLCDIAALYLSQCTSKNYEEYSRYMKVKTSKYKDQILQYENITFAQEKQSIMKREGVTEEHHRLDNMSFMVSGGGGTAKRHSFIMVVIPEEFLPP